MTGRLRNGFGSSALLGCALALALLLPACGGESEVDTPVARGAKVYRNVCATCHAADPNEDGVLGPAIAGSSQELLEARVVHGTYPPGYTPKRKTQQMVALPHLAPTIPDLAAYLQSVER